MTEEETDILSLYGVPGVGARIYARLTARFGSAAAVFRASKKELMLIDGIGPNLAGNILNHDRKSYVRDQKQRMEKTGAMCITRTSENYPPLLAAFLSAPPILFVRGDPQTLKKTSVAFVGTRKPSPHGVHMTRKLVAEAVNTGLCVVSGMAIGIDSTAHRAALDNGGVTVAVFGCGVDIIYPSINRQLSRDIMKSGCLVSHFAMGTACSPGNFPARNAIIVGLSLGTVVVEAPKKSGALITADLTLKARRPLFTVPGNAENPACEGTNNLLTRGAYPISNIGSVLSRLGKQVPDQIARNSPVVMSTKPVPAGLAGEILKTLSAEPLHIEVICRTLGKTVSEILTELTMLEIEGFIHQRPGKIFEKI